MNTPHTLSTVITPIIKQLYQQEIIDKKDATRILRNAKLSSMTSVHPYINLSDYKLINQLTDKPVTIEFIAQFVAEMNDMDYLKIDPTKINVNQVVIVLINIEI